MPTTPTPITALPAAPDRSDRATFSARATAMFTAIKDAFVGEANALATVTNSNAVEAAAAANTASTSAYNAAISEANAASSSGAAMWVSGTTYALGAATWSPIDRMIYRRIIAGAGTTDPSADATNWARIGTVGLATQVVTGTAQTAAINNHYILTNVAATTLTLPASPASGDTVWVTVTNGLFTNVIARNGQTIMGLSENMTIDIKNVTVQLKFVNSSWRLV